MLLILWGIVLVGFDLRVNDLDLSPDLIGWIMIALGCHRINELTRISSGWPVATVFALAGAAVSLAVALAQRSVDEASVRALSVLDGFVTVGVVWGLCTGMAVALATRGPSLERSLIAIRTIHLTIAGLGVISLCVERAMTPSWRSTPQIVTVAVVLTAVIAVVSALWLFGLMVAHRNAPELGGEAPPTPRPSPATPPTSRS